MSEILSGQVQVNREYKRKGGRVESKGTTRSVRFASGSSHGGSDGFTGVGGSLFAGSSPDGSLPKIGRD